MNIRKMQEVRNSWAHITSSAISKEKVIADVDTIIALMQAFDASMKETRDMENRCKSWTARWFYNSGQISVYCNDVEPEL